MEIKVVNNTFQSKTDAFNAIWESEEAWKGYVIRGRNSTNNLNNCVGIILCYEEGDYPIIIDFSTYIAKIRYGNELNNCIFVRAIQQYLVWLGYDIGKSGIDGKYGYNTYKAVIRFQRDNRINENGIVGIETYFNLSKGRSCKKK
ncbi:MAG: peptidoglycan-binding protein [Clostridiales bacterium]|nr:peptidoglycan-binding protein [Clostridiales bacterium]